MNQNRIESQSNNPIQLTQQIKFASPFSSKNISTILRASELQDNSQLQFSKNLQSIYQSVKTQEIKEVPLRKVISVKREFDDPNNDYRNIDIVIEYQDGSEKELVKQIQIEYVKNTGDIFLKSVVLSLLAKNLPIANMILSYYHTQYKYYEFVGPIPDIDSVKISTSALKDNRLILRLRKNADQISSKPQDQSIPYQLPKSIHSNSAPIELSRLGSSLQSTSDITQPLINMPDGQKADSHNQFFPLKQKAISTDIALGIDKNSENYMRNFKVDLNLSEHIWFKNDVQRRTKERNIGFVLQKVKEWRNINKGMTDLNGNLIRKTLDEGAVIVGISKKSLDDYLLQIRLGKKYGFDFKRNKSQNFGILRQFIKKKRVNEKKGKVADEFKIPKKTLCLQPFKDPLDIIMGGNDDLLDGL